MLDSLGQYRLLEQLGEGSTGDLYRARDTRVGRTVAVRVLPSEVSASPEERQGFLEAARGAATLSHPNIATVYESGESPELEGRLFLAAEFVPGQTLKSLIGGRPIQPRRAIDLAAQLADGLADAHAAGMSHGDVDSEAVVVTPKGHAKLLDFGLRRWTAGVVHPPRATADSAATERADIQALGGILYEMLTGSAPAGHAAQPARRTNRAVPPELDAIVGRAVAGGYLAAATFAAELRAVAAVMDVRAASEPVQLPASVRRQRPRSRLVPLLIAAALIVAGGLVFAWCGGL